VPSPIQQAHSRKVLQCSGGQRGRFLEWTGKPIPDNANKAYSVDQLASLSGLSGEKIQEIRSESALSPASRILAETSLDWPARPDDSSPKQLELLTAAVPNASRIGLLGNPNSTTYSSVLKTAQSAAKRAGLSLLPIEARSPQEIEDAFVALVRERMPAVMSAGDAVLYQQRHRIAELALANRLATMFSQREYAPAG
jgi:hypothetical protein